MTRSAAILREGRLASDDPTPLYLRLQERIRRAIGRGDLQPRDALPAEREIAEALAVSRVTVRKALSGLVESGLLSQRQGSGTFVAEPPSRIQQGLSRLTSFSEDMHSRGLAANVRWLHREVSPPSPQEAMRLQVSPRDTVCRLRRLRLAGDAPMAIERAAVPTRVLPDPALVDGSLYAALDRLGRRPVRALQRLSAANLCDEEAALLAVTPGTAALAIERVSFLADGSPVEFTQSRYRGDAYDFVAELAVTRAE